jgi:diguanylate cyclase (GGDEF)-like protein
LVVGWVLLTDALAVTVACWLSLSARNSRWDLACFGVLAACATAHMVATREPEERRRAAHRLGEHVDQTSIWLFSGALVLPVPLLLALVVLVRSQRYQIARKPPHRFVFTSAAIILGGLGVHMIAVATPLQDWLTGRRTDPHGPADLAIAAGAMCAALVWYFVAQALVVGMVRGLERNSWSLEAMLGDRQTNFFIATTLIIAMTTALSLAFSLALPALIVLVAVRGTRVEQQLRQLRHDSDQLRSDALHDPLTGLPNRRGFDAAAPLALLGGDAAEAGVLLLDLDHFKRLNTVLGHFGADQVLCAVADLLRTHTRHGDVLCRLGGEELAVVLPGSDRIDTVAVAERIRLAVAAMRTTITRPAGGRPVRLGEEGYPICTVSIGVALCPGHGSELAELLERADQALAAAKAAGRNRVVVAGGCLQPCPDDAHAHSRTGPEWR